MYSTGRQYRNERYGQYRHRQGYRPPVTEMPLERRIAFCCIQIEIARASGRNAAMYEQTLAKLQEQALQGGAAVGAAAQSEGTDKSIDTAVTFQYTPSQSLVK